MRLYNPGRICFKMQSSIKLNKKSKYNLLFSILELSIFISGLHDKQPKIHCFKDSHVLCIDFFQHRSISIRHFIVRFVLLIFLSLYK